MLGLAGFGANPHAREFGDFGVCQVRHGKAMAAQCCGIATAAGTALVAIMRAAACQPDNPHSLHALPSNDNAPSNALCVRLGFTLLGACDFEYPPGSGTLMRSNNWHLNFAEPILPNRVHVQGHR